MGRSRELKILSALTCGSGSSIIALYHYKDMRKGMICSLGAQRVRSSEKWRFAGRFGQHTGNEVLLATVYWGFGAKKGPAEDDPRQGTVTTPDPG